MSRLGGHPAARPVALALLVTVGAFGAGALSRLGSDAPTRQVPSVLPLEPSEVSRITVSSEDRAVELNRSPDGFWSGAPGVPAESETLIFSFEDQLFPLLAYRQLPGDTSSAPYGLDDPEIIFEVTDMEGREHQVALGASTFTGGGVYARRGADTGQMYLVPRRMMDDLRSLVAGKRIDAPNKVPGQVRQLDEQAQRKSEQQKVSWWLRQALETGTPLPQGLE